MNAKNYIRTRARSLPVFECLINVDWQESKLANIVVTRRHINGNFTVCLYFADLLCQGIKDTHWFFNIPSPQYDQFKKTLSGKQEVQPISYELAHNVIYAALEFAEEWGFQSHRDFDNVSKYMLNEDNDQIELIDIECGMEGKPAFVRFPGHSRAEADRIISQLIENAGPGNYEIIDETEHDDFEEDESENDISGDDEYDNHDDEEQDGLAGMSMDEKKNLFSKIANKLESLTEDENDQLGRLMRELLDDLCDADEVEKASEAIRKELSINVFPYKKVTPELLGLTENDSAENSFIRKAFLDTYLTIVKDREKAMKKLNYFRFRVAKGIPASDYLELVFLHLTTSEDFAQKLAEYSSLHPDYSMIKLLASQLNISDEPGSEFRRFDYFFPGRTELHSLELFNYLNFQILAANKEKNPNKIKALRDFLSGYDRLPENDLFALLRGLYLVNFTFIKNYIEVNAQSDSSDER
jgi:hypothetical protein